MRTELAYRVYSRWPENGDGWIHPADIRLARRLIPSTRVFRYDGREGPYLLLSYGKHRLRVRPTMRQAIRGDGFDLGDQVEVCSKLGKNRPFVATISEMRWNARYRVIHYQLRRRNMTLARPYTADDFRAVDDRAHFPALLPSNASARIS
ncbi:MAG TPA: hypothetical protein VHD36_12395 [Pirellulales bacterium]|nr:hypothetical protein [Pirellulales bacterium]